MDSETRKVVRALRKQGFTVDRTTKGHLRVYDPDGNFVTTHSGTPSEYRGWKNFLSDLRRAGFQWPPR